MNTSIFIHGVLMHGELLGVVADPSLGFLFVFCEIIASYGESRFTKSQSTFTIPS